MESLPNDDEIKKQNNPKESYEEWFINNVEQVTSIEKLASAMLFLLPDRYGKHELPMEGLTSILNLASSYHDYIWIKFSQNKQKQEKISNKQTKTLLEKSNVSFPESNLPYATILTVIEKTDVFIEVLANRLQNLLGIESNLKWSIVVVIETVKALLRFGLLIKTDGRIIAHRNLPTRQNMTFESKSNDLEKQELNKDITEQDYPDGRQMRTNLLTVQRALDKRDKIKKENSNEPTSTNFNIIIGEVLWILRPLVYLLFMKIFGIKSWKPWITSVIMDITSWQCTSKLILNKNENNELLQRKLLWILYLLKPPVFELLFEGPMRIQNMLDLQNIKVIGPFAVAIIEFLKLFRQRYFNISGS